MTFYSGTLFISVFGTLYFSVYIYIQDAPKIDIIFRDYSSFLFALVSGMPYENSVIQRGVFIEGHKGYFQWLQRIANNVLIDRDFLIRRYESEKIPYEIEVWNSIKMSKKTYEIVRAAYYLLCSLLQTKALYNLPDVTFHGEVAQLAFVDNLKALIPDVEDRELFLKVVSALKRESVIRVDYVLLEE